MEKILNKSNSFVFYKTNYDKLKKQNKDLKKRLTEANSKNDAYSKKLINSQKKLAKYTKPVILDKINKGKFDELTVSIKSPNPAGSKFWGDYYFAIALKKALEKKGFKVIHQEYKNWYDVDTDIVIVLRGLREYEPNYDEINLMWNISHPDLVSDEEYEKYDIVCVASDYYSDILNERLNVKVEPLLQCTDPEVFYNERDDSLEEELLFVGVTRHVYRQIVKDCMELNHDVSVYGRGWEKFIDEKYIKGKYIDNSELHKYYSSCKILLNDHWDDMKEFDFPSNRLFDALACGTFIISDEIPSEKWLFENNIETYSTLEELDEKINYYLNNPEERESKALKGKELVLKNHTFDNRVNDIIRYLKNLK